MTIEITADLIRGIAPQAKRHIVEGIAAHQGALARHGISDNALRLAHFLAQTGHESAHFRTTHEYWGPTDAQRRYEGRRDLGNTEPGDGSRFRGHGLIQLTGRANHREATAWLRREGFDCPDFEAEPEKAAEFPWALLCAVFYWTRRGLNQWADLDDCRTITRKINGGLNGYGDRQAKLARAKRALGLGSADVVPGDRTLDVKDLQEDLVALGYHLGPVDGVFGRLTRDALLAFQDDWDRAGAPLVVDGIAGPKTKEAIDAARDSGWRAPAEPRPATVEDLEAAGSGTVKDAKAAQKAGGVAGVGTAIVVAKEAVDAVEQADGLVDRLVAVSPWVLFAAVVLGAAWVVWAKGGSVIRRRLADHVSGAHRGR